jgi:signal recognition particle receptor subunit beta
LLEYDEEEKRMIWKIVYYGPALSGKTTNLLRLHDILNVEKRGEIFQMNTKEDRTLFFDLLPLAYQTPEGARLKIKLFTVPGQVQYDATRKAVLMRADGIVFVADSQRDQARNNFESFSNLEANALRVGIPFDRIPIVIQYNKRDLKEIVSEAEVRERWERAGLPIIFSSALLGQGVAETFQRIISLVTRRMEEQFQVHSRLGIEESGLNHYLLEGSDEKDTRI